jgi:hypothetical protein
MRLTKRDLMLMSYLTEQGVATSAQLQARFFSSPSRFQTRIAELIKHQYVESVRVGTYAAQIPSRFMEFAKNQGLRPCDLWRTKLYRTGARVRSAREHGNEISTPMFWQHQISLNEIRTALENTLPTGGLFLSDPEVRSEWARFKMGADEPIPDLVWRYRDESYAFEFERTSKGELRYFERFAAYHRSSYKKILYFSESEKICDLLTRTALRFPKMGVVKMHHFTKAFNPIDGFNGIPEFLKINQYG